MLFTSSDPFCYCGFLLLCLSFEIIGFGLEYWTFLCHRQSYCNTWHNIHLSVFSYFRFSYFLLLTLIWFDFYCLLWLYEIILLMLFILGRDFKDINEKILNFSDSSTLTLNLFEFGEWFLFCFFFWQNFELHENSYQV